VFIGL